MIIVYYITRRSPFTTSPLGEGGRGAAGLELPPKDMFLGDNDKLIK